MHTLPIAMTGVELAALTSIWAYSGSPEAGTDNLYDSSTPKLSCRSEEEEEEQSISTTRRRERNAAEQSSRGRLGARGVAPAPLHQNPVQSVALSVPTAHTHLVVGRADGDVDAGEHGRAPGVGPVDGVVQLHDGHHPPERLREDALAVGVAAPGRGQPEVLADEERLRAAGDRRRHWPQVDAAGAGARRPGRRGRHREQHEQPRPQRRCHLCRTAPGSGRLAVADHRVCR